MIEVSLSKSKYCRAKQCNKMFWLDKNKPEVAEDVVNDYILETGNKVGEVAKGLFGEHIDIQFGGGLEQMIQDTLENLKNVPNVITEASFQYNNNFCSVDILKNDIDGLEIYEVKSSTELKEEHLDDVAYQLYVLLSLGYKVKKVSVVHLNNEYVRRGELELDKLFVIQDVTSMAYSDQKKVKLKVDEIHEYMQNDIEQEQDISPNCFKPYKCVYWKYCTKHLPEKNVFSISRMRIDKKFELYNRGKYRYEDLVKQMLSDRYHQQVEVELYDKGPVINEKEIRQFMKTLTYPLYFLDFETFQQAIPEYDGVTPYMQIPFQYSLHYIEKEGGELKHKEFLAEAGIDPRRSFAESLVENVPDNVCVLAYNMGFEKGRIKDLAYEYADLYNHLMCIYNNIRDLMIPFSSRAYYTKEMEGSYSIKYVLPALFPNDPSLDYHNLPVVHNGSEASAQFATLAEKTKAEQAVIRKGLL